MSTKGKAASIFVLIVLVFSGILSACSKGTNEAESAPPSSKASETSAGSATSAEPARTITLNFTSWNIAGFPKPEDNLVIKNLEEKLGVKLDITGRKSDTYKEEYNLAIASGNAPDWFGNMSFTDYDKFVEQNLLIEVPEELIAQHAPRLTEWLKSYIGPDPFLYSKRNGKNYALPTVWTLGSTMNVTAIREDWLTNVGINKLPETIGELEEALQKLRNGDPDGNGKKDTYGWSAAIASPESVSDFFTPVFGAYGVYPGIFTEQDGKIVTGEIQPEAKEALSVLNSWYQQQLIDPEFIVDKAQNLQEKWLAEKYGYAVGAWWSFLPQGAFFDGFYHDQLLAKNPSSKVTVLSPPTGPQGKQGMVQLNPVQDPGVLFSKKVGEDPEKLAKYLEVLDKLTFDPDLLELTWFGIEGKTFKKSAEGDYEWIPPYDNAADRNAIGIGREVTFTDMIQDYTAEAPFMTKNAYLDLRAQTEKKAIGKIDILAPANRPVFNEYKQKLGQFAVKNYIDFITGKRPLSEFDQFVSEWNAMGGDKVMQEAQEVYQKMTAQ